MPMYAPPIRDMSFAIDELAGLSQIAALPGGDDATPDLVVAVLAEAGKLAAEVLAPLNPVGDRAGCTLANGAVTTPPGFADAYARFADGGWMALAVAAEHGGQGLPSLVGAAVAEIWQSANAAFALCPMLTQSAIELLSEHADPEQRALYLAPLVAGRWTATMEMTEPQAGSDLGAIRTRARREGDHYLITGQKIFITYGEHDLTENIVHLVLARTPDGPPGTKGLSLFIVPKFLPDEQGRLGRHNDLRCLALEHKLGIHASPTAVMSYGDEGGAVGFLVGAENRGIECMFTMMNSARLAVGVQGVAVAERAYQKARAYARERVQGAPAGARDKAAAPIIRHPDMRRMLMTMKARTEAARALAYHAAASHDLSRRHPDAAERQRHQRRADLLTPIVKAWCSQTGTAVADMAIQVFGGMGYIEETGVAQYLRDGRIAPIYEGTNGIQAMDLVNRKLWRDQGAAAREAIEAIQATVAALAACPGQDIRIIRGRLREALGALTAATDWLLALGADRDVAGAAAATPYLRLFAITLGGWLMARAAKAAQAALATGTEDAPYYDAKIVTARFYAEAILPQAGGLLAAATAGPHSVMALDEDQF